MAEVVFGELSEVAEKSAVAMKEFGDALAIMSVQIAKALQDSIEKGFGVSPVVLGETVPNSFSLSSAVSHHTVDIDRLPYDHEALVMLVEGLQATGANHEKIYRTLGRSRYRPEQISAAIEELNARKKPTPQPASAGHRGIALSGLPKEE